VWQKNGETKRGTDMTMNQTILIGRLCADPEMRVLQSGTATTRFTLAVDRAMSKEKKQEA